MRILLKFVLICFFIVHFIGCTSQNGKVVVEGASGEVSSSLEEDNKSINEGDRGNITAELQQKFEGIVSGNNETYKNWLTYTKK